MCELLALSARYPTHARQALTPFFQRGGLSGPHRDGWGLGIFQGKDAWLLRDEHSAASSSWAQQVLTQAPAGSLMLAHIRLATAGNVSLANTQPFSIVSQARRILFAHNGHVPAYQPDPEIMAFQPLGETDSERVFASTVYLLERVQALPQSEQLKKLEQHWQSIAVHGPLNILMSDGNRLYAFSNKRTQPDQTVSAPGMHLLKRVCPLSDNTDGKQQAVVLFASVPVTNEVWQPMQPDRLYVAEQGELVYPQLAIEKTRADRNAAATLSML